MKLKIAAAKLNERGCVAIIEGDDFERIDVVRFENTESAIGVCREAARRLRECADKFEALAKSDEPYKEKTHIRINRLKTDNSKA